MKRALVFIFTALILQVPTEAETEAQPEIVVATAASKESDSWSAVKEGNQDPGNEYDTFFGETRLLNGFSTRVFRISNNGGAVLNLTGSPRVEITGPNADEFMLKELPTSSLEAGQSSLFLITFSAKQPGMRRASVSIASNDPTHSLFSFAISGGGAMDVLPPQSISFEAPNTVYLGQGPVELVAEASSGMPVSLFLSGDAGVLAGSVFTPTKIGRVEISAMQSGFAPPELLVRTHAEAKEVIRVINVKADPNTLTLTRLNQRYDGTPKEIGTVGSTGAVTVTYQQATGGFGPAAPTAAGRYAVRAVANGSIKTGILVISKAPLQVIPEDKYKLTGQTNPQLTLRYEGFLGGDTEAVLTSLPVLTTTAKTASPGGKYAIKAVGGAAANYKLNYSQGMLVVDSVGGHYEALLVDSNGVASGKLNVSADKASRSFSGHLALAGEVHPLRFSGPLTFDHSSGEAEVDVVLSKNGSLYKLKFLLTLEDLMTGTLKKNGQDLATLKLGRRLYERPKPDSTIPRGSLQIHTSVLEPALPTGSDVPLGAGWAKVTVRDSYITMAGRLGDGTAYTCALSPDLTSVWNEGPGYRLWVQPYKPARTGSFLGGTFSHSEALKYSRDRRPENGVFLDWAKTGRAQDKVYSNGFGPLKVGLTINRWERSVTSGGLSGSEVIDLPGLLKLRENTTFDVQHSATGSASDADLPTELRMVMNRKGNPVISVEGAVNPTHWNAKLNPNIGTITGSFELKDGAVKRVVRFSGVLRQPEHYDEAIGDGHFLIPAAPGAPHQVSGEILFTVYPRVAPIPALR